MANEISLIASYQFSSFTLPSTSQQQTRRNKIVIIMLKRFHMKNIQKHVLLCCHILSKGTNEF